jgi:hypothetical protein
MTMPTTKRIELLFAVREMPQLQSVWEESEEELRSILDAPNEPNEVLASRFLNRMWRDTAKAEFVTADNLLTQEGKPWPGASASMRRNEILGVVCRVTDVPNEEGL